ncbi:MAG: 4a-hydroxytetrahydrobiopterin dehydratase [Myxococcota bacterium]
MAKLDDATIESKLAELPEWTREGDTIVRKLKASSVREAVALINRLADMAEGANHHPDVTWTWRFLTISFTTHDAGGLTNRDFHLARVVEDVLPNG